jgi:hypothetical protein
VASWRTAARSLAIAVAAATITLVVFTPRFVNWRALDIPELERTCAEVHRAADSLRQLDDPWAPIGHPSNNVIAWRLLFPVVWHYLKLPHWTYLALPWVGCVLVLWFVAGIADRELRSWWQTWMVTTLFAALPWFFVSTGWLAYFDSWLVLGILIAAFVRSRWAVGLACLLTPWVDERFVMALPLVVAVRAMALNWFEEQDWRSILGDLGVIVAATIPCPAVRVVSWLQGDPESTAYVRSHWEQAPSIPVARYAQGLWSGFRAAWIMIAAAIWFVCRRAGLFRGAVFGFLVAASAIGGLFIAADMSRTLMIETPVALLGMLLWHHGHIRSFRCALPAILAANLLLPASHVVWTFTNPIRSLYAGIDAYRHPPRVVDPAQHTRLGDKLVQEGNPQSARGWYEVAIRLDQGFAPAYVGRATARFLEGDRQGAAADLETALRLQPGLPDALFVRAALRHGERDTSGATDDLKDALQNAPPSWPLRERAQQLLQEVTGEK